MARARRGALWGARTRGVNFVYSVYVVQSGEMEIMNTSIWFKSIQAAEPVDFNMDQNLSGKSKFVPPKLFLQLSRTKDNISHLVFIRHAYGLA